MNNSTSAQHTPGPWSVGGKYAFKTVLLNAHGESIASGGNNRAVQGEELEASLRVASASLEMLEALHAWRQFVRSGDGALLRKAEQMTDAAIAKAAGGAT